MRYVSGARSAVERGPYMECNYDLQGIRHGITSPGALPSVCDVNSLAGPLSHDSLSGGVRRA